MTERDSHKQLWNESKEQKMDPTRLHTVDRGGKRHNYVRMPRGDRLRMSLSR